MSSMDDVLGKAAGHSPVSASVPFLVTLTGPRKTIDSTIGYVDLWTKGTGWPRGEDPIAAIHWTSRGFGTFAIDPTAVRNHLSKITQHPTRQAWLAAVVHLTCMSQLDMADALRLVRECWRSAPIEHPATHDDWVRITQRVVLVVQARHEAGIGMRSLTGCMYEVMGLRDEIADNAVSLIEAKAEAARLARRREARRRWL